MSLHQRTEPQMEANDTSVENVVDRLLAAIGPINSLQELRAGIKSFVECAPASDPTPVPLLFAGGDHSARRAMIHALTKRIEHDGRAITQLSFQSGPSDHANEAGKSPIQSAVGLCEAIKTAQAQGRQILIDTPIRLHRRSGIELILQLKNSVGVEPVFFLDREAPETATPLGEAGFFRFVMGTGISLQMLDAVLALSFEEGLALAGLTQRAGVIHTPTKEHLSENLAILIENSRTGLFDPFQTSADSGLVALGGAIR